MERDRRELDLHRRGAIAHDSQGPSGRWPSTAARRTGQARGCRRDAFLNEVPPAKTVLAFQIWYCARLAPTARHDQRQAVIRRKTATTGPCHWLSMPLRHVHDAPARPLSRWVPARLSLLDSDPSHMLITTTCGYAVTSGQRRVAYCSIYQLWVSLVRGLLQRVITPSVVRAGDR